MREEQVIKKLEKDIGKTCWINFGTDQPALAPNQYVMLGGQLSSGKFPLVSSICSEREEVNGFVKQYSDVSHLSQGYIFFKGNGSKYHPQNISNQMTREEKLKILKLWEQQGN